MDPHWLYYSHDMSLVEVFLGGRKRDASFTPGRTLHLPRAMIQFADGYARPDYPMLPDLIRSKTIRLGFVYPDGRPLSIAARDYARRHGVDERAALKSHELRTRSFSGVVRHSELAEVGDKSSKNPWMSLDSLKESFVFVEKKDGMTKYLKFGRIIHYVPEDKEGFYYAWCSKNTQPTQWCRYVFRINEHYMGSFSFADLSFHGGRRFAQERIRTIRRILCGYFECDIVDQDGRISLEGAR